MKPENKKFILKAIKLFLILFAWMMANAYFTLTEIPFWYYEATHGSPTFGWQMYYGNLYAGFVSEGLAILWALNAASDGWIVKSIRNKFRRKQDAQA